MSRPFILKLLLVVGLSGCATTERPPEVQTEANEYAGEGHEAFAKGDFESSVEAYGRALELHRSIDDPVGIVRNLVNLAVVQNAAGNPGNAAVCLDAVERYTGTLESSNGGIRDRELNLLIAEASWMRAFLHADSGSIDKAWNELKRARGPGGRSTRELGGRFDNLEARLHLESGNAQAALETARRALRKNRSARDKNETADSLRFIGRASYQTGAPSDAYESFRKALELDREQGRPSKVFDDLIGMAKAASASGRSEQAIACADRAAHAARAAGNTASENEAVRLRNSF